MLHTTSQTIIFNRHTKLVVLGRDFEGRRRRRRFQCPRRSSFFWTRLYVNTCQLDIRVSKLISPSSFENTIHRPFLIFFFLSFYCRMVNNKPSYIPRLSTLKYFSGPCRSQTTTHYNIYSIILYEKILHLYTIRIVDL